MYTPTLTELQTEVDAGNVKRRTHPTLPLSVYTYTEKCTYAEAWNPVTMACRGLVVEDTTGRVVGRPFRKFFGYHDHINGKAYAPPLPDLPFRVYDKMDGSMGTIFHYAGDWHVATRGSFLSGQAGWAQGWLDASGPHGLHPDLTYVVEIVYSENRIVVDYGGYAGLNLLAVFDTASGREVPLSHPSAARAWVHMGGDCVREYKPPRTVEDLARLAMDNKDPYGHDTTGMNAEGWIVRFEDGTRVKIKTADYVRLHGVLSRTSTRTVWEALSSGSDPASVLGTVPDEFLAWVREVTDDLTNRRVVWEACARADFALLWEHRHDRRVFASHAVRSPYRAALFRLLDGRDITDLAWKAVRPEHGETPHTTPGERAETGLW